MNRLLQPRRANTGKCVHLGPLTWFALMLLVTFPLLASEPLGTPDVADIEYPNDRPPSQAEVSLGWHLFFDTQLSGDNSQSCASCHNPDLGFGDGMGKSRGINGIETLRHTPPLYNLAWNYSFLWDGKAATLEEQAMMPLFSKHEMDKILAQLESYLKGSAFYKQRFSQAYGDAPINQTTIARALAAYVRSLIAIDAPFDRFIAGQETALGPRARRGLALFKDKAGCTECHDGPLFTDGSFHSLGIEDEDRGRGGVIGDASMNHRFKTPSLRNVAITAPYMHDGSLATLEQVVRFYNDGGGPASHKDSLIKPLELNEGEIADIVAFLGTLTSPLAVERPTYPSLEEVSQ